MAAMTLPKIDLSKLAVIAVEDNTAGGAIIALMMRRMGFQKHMLDPTGKNVVSMALSMKPPPDLILCDINLPGTSGYEIIRAIRDHPELNSTKVVAVTASDPHLAIPRCKAAGFDGYIAKPLSRRRLTEQITRLMRGMPVWDAR